MAKSCVYGRSVNDLAASGASNSRPRAMNGTPPHWMILFRTKTAGIPRELEARDEIGKLRCRTEFLILTESNLQSSNMLENQARKIRTFHKTSERTQKSGTQGKWFKSKGETATKTFVFCSSSQNTFEFLRARELTRRCENRTIQCHIFGGVRRPKFCQICLLLDTEKSCDRPRRAQRGVMPYLSWEWTQT